MSEKNPIQFVVSMFLVNHGTAKELMISNIIYAMNREEAIGIAYDDKVKDYPNYDTRYITVVECDRNEKSE